MQAITALTSGSANASCRSAARDSTDEEEKESISRQFVEYVTLNPFSSRYARERSSTSVRTLVRLPDGAMIRISSPFFSFGGIIHFTVLPFPRTLFPE